jgi:hypothetical protein
MAQRFPWLRLQPYNGSVSPGKRIARFALWGLSVLLLGCLLAVFFLLRPQADLFQFLAGRQPSLTGVSGYHSHTSNPVGIGQDYRIYSWQQNYNEVLSTASRELESQGYRVTYRGKDGTVWMRGDFDGVMIGPGQSRSRREGLVGKRQMDENWVTVFVGNPAGDSLGNHLRLFLEPGDY